jgi:hypothetical protein
MGTFLTTLRQSFRRTDTTRTGAESLAAAGPNASTGIVETDDNKPAVDDRLIADSGAAEVAAYTEDADRTADQLVASVQHEMTLANTPLWFQYPDAGYGDDDFADDHSEEAVDRLEEHLRSHAELRVMPKWAGDYAALDADDAALAAEADEARDESAGQVPQDLTGDVDEL